MKVTAFPPKKRRLGAWMMKNKTATKNNLQDIPIDEPLFLTFDEEVKGRHPNIIKIILNNIRPMRSHNEQSATDRKNRY